MKNSLLSVIMPVYNGERFLEEAIKSVLKQTFTEFEFVIFNDGSNDDSHKIIKKFSDKRIKYLFSEENFGIVNAYNRCIKASSGSIIAIADQDDYNDYQRISVQYEYLLENKLDLCGTFFNIIDSNNKIIESKRLPTQSEIIRIALFWKRVSIFNPTVMIKKEVFLNYGLFQSEFLDCFDYEFYLRIKNKLRIGNVPKVLYSWRYWKNSTSNKNKEISSKMTTKVSLFYLEKEKDVIAKNHYELIKGFILFYDNKLLKSLTLLLSNKSNNKFIYSTKLRLIIIIFFGNVFAKVVRKRSLYNLRFFIILKRLIYMLVPDKQSNI